MGLSRVWVATLADGLVRADSIIGITTHPSPAIAGKSPRWLLDVVLPATTGSGAAGSWVASPLHRTLVQTDQPPQAETTQLAAMLARLDVTDAAGVITVERVRDSDTAGVRLGFTPFTSTEHDERPLDGTLDAGGEPPDGRVVRAAAPGDSPPRSTRTAAANEDRRLR